MAQWHQKHFSTQWGVAILGFFIIVTALLIPYMRDTQTTSSHASFVGDGGAPAATSTPTPTPTPGPKTYGSCSVGSTRGTCQDLNKQPTCGGFAGSYVDGYCSGPSNIKCCISAPSCQNFAHDVKKGVGYCLSTTGPERYKYKGGKFYPGHCPGPSTVQCYVIKGL